MDFNNYDFVSFDIFDTLLSRKIARPKDLFSLIQANLSYDSQYIAWPDLVDNFSVIREKAEEKARQHKVSLHGGEPEILISDIYDQVSQRIPTLPKHVINMLISLEIEMEKAVLFKSIAAEDLFNKARAAGCKIIVISDMYLPSKVLRELLENSGYKNLDDVAIFSSGEEGVSKHSGELYPKVRNKLNLTGKRWLHIGDNKHSDVEMAKRHSIDGLHADWSEYDGSVSRHWQIKDVIGESINISVTNIQARQFFSDDPLTEIGFKIFGPLMLGYTSWIHATAKKLNVEKLLFLARDAHLIRDIFLNYYNKDRQFDYQYVYLSRASTYKMGMTDWPMHRIWHLFGGKNRKSIKNILSVIGLNAEEHLSDIHDVGFPDVNYVPSHGERDKVHWLINKLFMHALLQNKKCRDEFSDYFKEAVGDYSSVALVDIGWMGNIQSVFSRALGDIWADKKISGLYLATFEGAKDNKSYYNDMKGWLTNFGEPRNQHDLILSGGVELLEFAMADNTGSTKGYQKIDGKTQPVKENVSEEELEYLKKAQLLQKGILSFFEYISSILAVVPSEAMSSRLLSEPFFELVSNPSSYELEALVGITHSEAAGANNGRIALAEKLSLKERLLQGHKYSEMFEQSYWKEGYKRINRKKFWKKYI
jgi:predicted HAD superfamily hydrolase